MYRIIKFVCEDGSVTRERYSKEGRSLVRLVCGLEGNQDRRAAAD